MTPRRPAVRCTATSPRNGRQCLAYAVTGATVCSAHGGLAPQVREAGRRRWREHVALERAAESLARQGVQPIGDPLEEYARLAAEALALKDWAGAHVAELQQRLTVVDRQGAEQLRAVIGLLERAMDRSGKFLAEYVRLGIDERRVALSERQGELVALVLTRVLVALGHDPQARPVRELVHRELEAVRDVG